MKRIAQALLAIAAALAASLGGVAQAQPTKSAAAELHIGPYAPPAPHAALYSFSDVFRLTVAGAAMADNPLAAISGAAAAEMPVRLATFEPQASGYVFSIAVVPEPQRWLLLLSGLALAGWVARRRLIHSF
jgi:hypothetical protein